MKAAVVEAPGRIVYKEVDKPECPRDSLLLRVRACAICGSDVRIVYRKDNRARFPMITGHEMSAEVVQVGPEAQGFQVGDRVVVAPGVSCGTCYACQKGWENLCLNMISIGYFWPGSFAEYMVPPASALSEGFVNKIPDGLSYEEATLAEPLACCINGQDLLGVSDRDTVAIIGAGPTGFMHAKLARYRGCRKLIIVQRSQHRLDLAREILDADAYISSASEDAVQRVLAETDGHGADVVVVAAPSGQAQQMALEMVGLRGRISFYGGLAHDEPMANLNSNLIHYKECAVIGASSSSGQQNRDALALMGSGAVTVGNMITHRFPLEQIVSALETARDKKGLKIVVLP